ncbi:MAG: peptide deformylase [Theionarchaea archaeon]|nr:peptide deformylase [Theionarchaea archaeon]MBU7036912.1 peptide deformylase [Theionarchaea archaeon]
MAVREILLLGNPSLYKVCERVEKEETDMVRSLVGDLHDTLMDFRKTHKMGRAIAAPQIGVNKRLLYLHVGEPVVLINPLLEFEDTRVMEVWDDCMSFPDLLVKIKRYSQCRVTFFDLKWKEQKVKYCGDMSELIQHEYDHLNGILAVSRAVDGRSFCLRSETHFLGCSQ